MKTCDYTDNPSLIKKYLSGDENAGRELIENNIKLVHSIACRFRDRGVEYEDIVEIGKMGLVKAIHGFDETLGNSFSTYAFPYVLGEIKRYLRDDGIIRISRTIKKNACDILIKKEEFYKKHKREPKISELCSLCDLSQEDIINALEACSPPRSLEEKIGNGDKDMVLGDTLSTDDSTNKLIESIALRQAIDGLCEFDKRLIVLRFYKNLTQCRTADILGVSQVTISRSEKRILSALRQEISG